MSGGSVSLYQITERTDNSGIVPDNPTLVFGKTKKCPEFSNNLRVAPFLDGNNFVSVRLYLLGGDHMHQVPQRHLKEYAFGGGQFKPKISYAHAPLECQRMRS